jgi:hypothetical protein
LVLNGFEPVNKQHYLIFYAAREEKFKQAIADNVVFISGFLREGPEM